MIILIVIIVILLDFLLSYFIPNYFNNLNYFYPMLTLTFLVYCYKKNKNYNKIIIITGLIYDLLFSYIFLFNTLIFLLFSKILKKIDNLIRYNYLISIIVLILFIFLYDLILFILVYISGYDNINFNDLIYKFSHSLILNITFYILLTIIFYNKKIIFGNNKIRR